MVPPRRRLLACVIVAALLAPPATARADPMLPTPFLAGGPPMHFDFDAQAHFGTAVALADWKHPGGVAVRGGFSLAGLGLAGALRLEPVAGVPGVELLAAAQLRPVVLGGRRVYRIFDPFVSLGGELGGGGGDARVALIAGGGFDLALVPGLDTYPAITVDYEIRPFRTPSGLPLQLFQVGPTLRWVNL